MSVNVLDLMSLRGNWPQAMELCTKRAAILPTPQIADVLSLLHVHTFL